MSYENRTKRISFILKIFVFIILIDPISTLIFRQRFNLSSSFSNNDIFDYDPHDLHPKTIPVPSFRSDEIDGINSSYYDINTQNYSDYDVNGWWEVNLSNVSVHLIRLFRIYLRKQITKNNDTRHSCYEYKAISRASGKLIGTGPFCYPSLVITGVPKCSTTALHSLLKSVPFTATNTFKENCIVKISGLLNYMATMQKDIDSNKFYFDGCVDVVSNMIGRSIFRSPKTIYIVMIRNFADIIWSAYNYWCDPGLELGCSRLTFKPDIKLHKRSPELFHDILLSEIYGNTSSSSLTAPTAPARIRNPCKLGKTIYVGYMEYLWKHVPKESTLVLASEELDLNPEYLWQKISQKVGFPSKPLPNFEEFKQLRYNTQTGVFRDGKRPIMKSNYYPGLYAISGSRPLLNSTRAMLDQCWYKDCLEMSRLTGHSYQACHGE